MATKEEYIKALNGMVEVYDNLDGCMSAMNIFNEGVHLLTGLVNEHFEEKSETNYEHYKDEIIEECYFTVALVDGKPHKCACVSCSDCRFSTGHGCSEKTKEWLKQPYKKPVYKLTQFEYDLLNAYKVSGMLKSIRNYSALFELYEKGYFKDIDIDMSIPIHEILENCEVSER